MRETLQRSTMLGVAVLAVVGSIAFAGAAVAGCGRRWRHAATTATGVASVAITPPPGVRRRAASSPTWRRSPRSRAGVATCFPERSVSRSTARRSPAARSSPQLRHRHLHDHVRGSRHLSDRRVLRLRPELRGGRGEGDPGRRDGGHAFRDRRRHAVPGGGGRQGDAVRPPFRSARHRPGKVEVTHGSTTLCAVSLRVARRRAIPAAKLGTGRQVVVVRYTGTATTAHTTRTR